MVGTIERITAEVIGSFLRAVGEEMGATPVMTAYWPNIGERGDSYTAGFARAGRSAVHQVSKHVALCLATAVRRPWA